MGELEDRINSVLSDPEQFARLSAMAQAIMGNASSPGGEPPAPGESVVPPENAVSGEAAGPGASLPAGLVSLLRGAAGGKNPRLAALEALSICLDEKRRGKLTRAMKLARVLRLAQAGLLGTEGKDV